MYTGNIKLFAKNKKELKTLMYAVRKYILDIGIEIWHRKMYHVNNNKAGKDTWLTEWNYQNKKKLELLDKKKTYKYLGILEADTIKKVVMKEKKIKKGYLRRKRKLLKIKLYRRNIIKGINPLAVTPRKLSGPFLKWTREELKQMDQRKRQIMTRHPEMTLTGYMS